ncbi:MAG: hypothetical protein F4049_01835 [Gemmatimonadetes bacterium]|nr:hypothetical protein [Gemmatimonadota bacterium]
MRWLIALLWAVPLWGQQIAVGDSVQYNGGRYEVRFVAGEPTFADDADFVKRLQPVAVHTDLRRRCVSWLEPSFVHQDSVAADNPLRLQKTFAEIDAATKTTGLVLFRDEDTTPTVNVPVADVTKIESD